MTKKRRNPGSLVLDRWTQLATMTQPCKCKKGTCIYCSKCPKCACKCRNKRKRRTRSNNGFYREESSSDDEGIANATSSSVAQSKEADLSQLLRLLGMKQSSFKSISGMKKRSTMKLSDLTQEERSRVVHLAKTAV